MQNITQIRFDHGAVDHVARLCRERMNFMRLQRRMKGITFNVSRRFEPRLFVSN